ncbi:MAG: hypothetical protein KKE76_14320 [Gammaproteobacteria bacterium]|nr:hypothetical protein [Gammaproteobacteria bacterium]
MKWAFRLIVLLLSVTTAGSRADTLMLCYGYGCKLAMPVSLSQADWAALRALFPATRTAAEERAAVAHAVGLFERIAGQVAPIHRDLAGNPLAVARQPGQLDCIAESLNTAAWLILLDQHGLLRWHRVVERAYRAPWVLDQHWAARIEEVATGQYYVVDSWPQDNGEPALIQTLEDWRAKLTPRQHQAMENSPEL